MVFQNYALYPHLTRRREHRLRPAPAQDAEGRDQRARRVGGEAARPDAVPRPQAEGAVGRPAPARRDGPRDRAPAAGLPDGRAALEPRREAARPDARRHRASSSSELGDDDDLRHARPGRGDDDGRPRRGDEQGRPAAGRRAAAALRPAREPVRRGLHRHAADEPARGDRARQRRRLRSTSAATRSPIADEAVAQLPGRARVRRAAGRSSACAPATSTRRPGRDDLPQITRRASSSSRRSAASRWPTSRSTRGTSRARAAEEEEILASRGRAETRGRLAAEPRRVVPAARPAEARRRGTRSRSTRRTSTSSTRRRVRRFASAAAVASSRLRSSSPPQRPARVAGAARRGAALASLSQLPAQQLARVAAHLLRDAGPLRERRPRERHAAA